MLNDVSREEFMIIERDTVKQMKKAALILTVIFTVTRPSRFPYPPGSRSTDGLKSIIIKNTYTGEYIYRLSVYNVGLDNERIIIEVTDPFLRAPVLYTLYQKEKLYKDLSLALM